jgi:hypothetical protein
MLKAWLNNFRLETLSYFSKQRPLLACTSQFQKKIHVYFSFILNYQIIPCKYSELMDEDALAKDLN